MDINVNEVVSASIEVQNARMALTRAEDALRSVFQAYGQTLGGQSVEAPVTPLNQIDRVLQAARKFNGSGFGPKDVVKASGIAYGSVGVHLTKLVRQGKLRKLGQGRYEAK